ncbi:MAG TPA: AraC family ligand binding domain-containing protein [Vicinamibacterales bacterium]|nr:AraC family ligand binding domain-containing protein [Vicinamibacterales bacterium]
MPNTYIDTNALPHTTVAGSGEYVEVLNKALCGAKNVVGSLRWLGTGDTYNVVCDAKTNQLLYLMEGEGTITLNGKDHQVAKGHGIYLGPTESARIAQRGTAPLKLFQLVVPKFS